MRKLALSQSFILANYNEVNVKRHATTMLAVGIVFVLPSNVLQYFCYTDYI